MPNTNELLEELKSLVFSTRTIVSCPSSPVTIPGITAADALDANDCMGTQFTVRVPKSGIIWGGVILDLDDEGLQIDLQIFKASIVQVANDAAYAPTASDIQNFITELNFFVWNDHGTVQTSEVMNYGKAYSCPSGLFTVQAVTRGAHNIAAGSSPKVQFHIQSFDPEFVEA